MAIQPIDLQTLYTQLENVSKNVAFQQQGVQVRDDMQLTEQARQEFLKKRAVTKTREEEEQADTVQERKNGNNQQQAAARQNKKESEEQEDEPASEIQIHDPLLGRIIDIHG